MLRGLTIHATISKILAVAGLAAIAAPAAAATVVDFASARWTVAAGGDGRLRTLVVVDAPWSWSDANALASAMGASLSHAQTPAELSFLVLLSDHPGAFDCAGPWLGGYRAPQGAWLWSDGLPVQSFGWPPFRPAQSIVFASALLMSGIDGPDGRWLDVFPEVDAGVATRSAMLTWTAFTDCDHDDLPDILEIAANPALDANHDGQLDACAPRNPADLNGDGRVDAADITALLNAWGDSGGAADIDGNGTVGAGDLALLLNAWTGA